MDINCVHSNPVQILEVRIDGVWTYPLVPLYSQTNPWQFSETICETTNGTSTNPAGLIPSFSYGEIISSFFLFSIFIFIIFAFFVNKFFGIKIKKTWHDKKYDKNEF